MVLIRDIEGPCRMVNAVVVSAADARHAHSLIPARAMAAAAIVVVDGGVHACSLHFKVECSAFDWRVRARDVIETAVEIADAHVADLENDRGMHAINCKSFP